MATGIPMHKWGKDHWSTFAYIETRCVDGMRGLGKPKPAHIQTNHNRHPFMGNVHDGSAYGIRLKGGETLPGPDYDEWDCIDDMENNGLINNIGTGINPVYRMTKRGNHIAGHLRAYKTQGGNYATFYPEMEIDYVEDNPAKLQIEGVPSDDKSAIIQLGELA